MTTEETRGGMWLRLRDVLATSYAAVRDVGEDRFEIDVVVNDRAVEIQFQRIDVAGRPWVSIKRPLGSVRQYPSNHVLTLAGETGVGAFCVEDARLVLYQALPLESLAATDLHEVVDIFATDTLTQKPPQERLPEGPPNSIASWVRDRPRPELAPSGRVVLEVARRLFGGTAIGDVTALMADALIPDASRLASELRAGFSTVALRVEAVIGDGPLVACHWSAAGTHDREAMGIPPTGARMSWTGTIVCAVSDGKVTAMSANVDVYGLLQQMRAALKR